MNRSQQFSHDHSRLLCGLLALLGAGLTVYEWHAIRHETFYSPTAAVVGPFCAILFAALGMFPKKAEPDEKRKKILQAIVIFGLIAGVFNWFAMTHF
jgi:hypothetical protein